MKMSSSDIGFRIREIRGQNAPVDETKPVRKEKKYSNGSYENFICRYKKAQEDETIAYKFNSVDLAYLFRAKAEEHGIKYVMSKGRDFGSMSNLLKHYTPRDVCIMIEFIFDSPQDYLDPQVCHPTVLVSSWQSTIYRDSQLWIDDKYVPRPKKAKKTREWDEKVTETKAKIGEWK